MKCRDILTAITAAAIALAVTLPIIYVLDRRHGEEVRRVKHVILEEYRAALAD